MLNQKTFIYLIFSLSLIFISGSFLTGFQTWLIYLSQTQISTHSTPKTASFIPKTTGIRQIISSPVQQVEVQKAPVHLSSKRERTRQPVQMAKPIEVPVPSKPRLEPVVEKPAPINQKVPVLVVYENEIVVEFPKSLASENNLKKALTYLMLSPTPLRDYDLLANHKFNLAKKPFLFLHVLNQQKQPIRYPKQAYAYADYLVKNKTETLSDEEGTFVEVHIPLVNPGLKGPAKTYQAWVQNYAQEFDVDPALIYAIMETESAFNPKAVSRSNAIGLMQLKPASAGRDVYQYIDGRPGMPSKHDLFDSHNNIRMGAAYLGLLQHDYLGDILDEKIKKMLTISSYNGGLSTVLKLFGKTPEQAVARLNRMSVNQVYRKLRFGHVSRETRQYLDKVLQAESRYKKMLSAKDLNV